jgi:hypothetical protein
LEQDDPGALRGRLPDEPLRPLDVRLPVFTAFHLGCSDFDGCHHKPPALTVFWRRLKRSLLMRQSLEDITA